MSILLEVIFFLNLNMLQIFMSELDLLIIRLLILPLGLMQSTLHLLLGVWSILQSVKENEEEHEKGNLKYNYL